MENSQPSQGGEEEEFIDMVVSPSSLQSKEFEFQMCKASLEKQEQVTPSPADELFYKGTLLPLHLPPRLQMVQSLLQNSISQNQAFEEECETETPIFSPTTSFTAPPTSSNSPLESCSISPTDSCRASCELNPDEYFFQWSTGVSGLTKGGDAHLPKKGWSKKIKLIKQFVFSQKLKSSRDYMRSLFTRPGCAVEAKSAEGWNISKAKEYNNVIESEMDDHIGFTCHRLSFSGAIKRNSTSNKHSSSSSATTSTTTTTTSSTSSSSCSCSSSSYSLKSTKGFYEINLLEKRVSTNLEAENSIEGAIAHCKKSQQKQDFSEEKRHQSEVEGRKHAEREEER